MACSECVRWLDPSVSKTGGARFDTSALRWYDSPCRPLVHELAVQGGAVGVTCWRHWADRFSTIASSTVRPSGYCAVSMALDAKTRHHRLEARRARRRRRQERTPEFDRLQRLAYKARVRDRGAAAQITFLKAIGDHVRARAKMTWTARQERRLERFEWPQRPLSHRHLALSPETGLWRPVSDAGDGKAGRRFSLGRRRSG